MNVEVHDDTWTANTPSFHTWKGHWQHHVHFMCSAWAARVAPKPSCGIAQSTTEKKFEDLLEILSRVWPPLISKMILKLNIFFMPCFLFDSSSSGENRCVLSLIQGRFLKPHVCWTMLMVSLVLHWDVSKCWGATIWINLTMSPTTAVTPRKQMRSLWHTLTEKPITLTGKPNRIWWIRGQAWASKKLEIMFHHSNDCLTSQHQTSWIWDCVLLGVMGVWCLDYGNASVLWPKVQVWDCPRVIVRTFSAKRTHWINWCDNWAAFRSEIEAEVHEASSDANFGNLRMGGKCFWPWKEWTSLSIRFIRSYVLPKVRFDF